jgi:uncharacterized membrane protein (GlpM family)
MKIQDVLPVMVSVVVIVLVAILEKQSKLVAAITATMPLAATLALWIVYSSNEGEQAKVMEFSRGLVLGVLPSIGFLIAVWFAARAGLRLVPMLLVGYAVWGVGVGVILVGRRLLGV